MAKPSPFDFLTSITYTKVNLLDDPEYNEEDFQPYLINHSLSMFVETILYSADMNIFNKLDKKLQYEYLLHTISKRKRFAKWIKPEVDETVKAAAELFQLNSIEAKDLVLLLNDEQKEEVNRLFKLKREYRDE